MDGPTPPTTAGNGALGPDAAPDAALRASEARFRALVEATAQTVWTTDAAGLVIEDSPSWRAFTGQTLDEWLGEGWVAAVHPDDRAYALTQWREAAATARPVNTEFRLRHAASGGWRLTRVRAVPVRGPDGAIREWVGMNTDITEARAAELALAASEARYRTLFASIDEGFCLIEVLFAPGDAADGGDGDGEPRAVDYRFVEANPAFVAQTGLADAVGRTMRELAPAHEAHWFATYGRVARTGEPVRFEAPAAALGRWYSVYAFRVGAPGAHRVAVLFTDVTAAKRAAAERDRLLREAEAARAAAEAERQRLAAVIAHLPVGVTFAEAPAGRHAESNPAAVAIWGVFPASPDVAAYSRDFVGWRPGPGAPGSPDEAARRIASAEWPLARALAHGEVVRDELVEIERPDGTRRLVRLSAAPVPGADGGRAGALVTSTDVTEQEATLRALEAARRAAEDANRAKSEFLAVMSHELRTPLNAIQGYAELLELGIHGPVTEAQRTALARIQTSQRHLLGLIAGVLDYSRVEAGAVTYRLADVPVGEAVAEAEALVAPQLRAKGLGYTWSGAPPELRVRADREKLQQVLLNLLGNAVKFTDARDGVAGRVEVACDAADGRVRLHIRDTGDGIAADARERIFEPFVQADQRLTRPHAGVGLGLAISRDLARGMGGDLTVESTPGVGSTFTLTLPAAG